MEALKSRPKSGQSKPPGGSTTATTSFGNPAAEALSSVKLPSKSADASSGSFFAMLWHAAGKFPFHAATLVSVPAVAVVLTLVGGLSLYKSLWASLSMSDPVGATLSVLLALVVATYTLLATLTVSHMRGEIQREQRDAAADLAQKDIAHKQDAIDASIRELRHDSERSLELQHTMSNRDRPSAMTRKNDEAPWSNIAPNSEMTSIAGQGRLDVKTELLPNDKRRYVVDEARIARTTLPRFMPSTALRSATYILFVGSKDDTVGNVPPSVAVHLAIFRAIRKLARRLGVEPTLGRVRFYLIQGSPAATRITGEYLLNGQRVPFVNTYLDVGLMYGFESGIVDDRVLTSLHSEDVAIAHHVAGVLTVNQVVYRLEELEAIYGRYVDSTETNPADLSGMQVPPARLPEIVAFDDHFRFD